jgi:2-polyprenyl-6-methoxyphenol hydroxylase-like FAD-dependent oxidoreductase
MQAGEDAVKTFAAKHYEGAGWKIDEIMQLMMSSKDFYASEVAQVMVPSLHKGRFVLVGDAGYAAGPTGGGTSLAMAGAYVLAGEMMKHQDDLAAGLQAYEERMKPLISDMQKIPPFIPGAMAPQTAWGLWLRNHIFALITWSRILEVLQQYFANAFASTDKYQLPDYKWPT